jgi:hypothetical protein
VDEAGGASGGGGGEARPLVLKQIFVGQMDPGESVAAGKEARILEELHHPNIIAFHAAFVDTQFLCIVTEFCNGGDLAQYIRRTADAQQRIAEELVLEWTVQLSLALDYIHTRSVRAAAPAASHRHSPPRRSTPGAWQADPAPRPEDAKHLLARPRPHGQAGRLWRGARA